MALSERYNLFLRFPEQLFIYLFIFCVRLCPSSQVPDFNDMYELYDPCTVMFFFRNKHIMIDLGTGNNNKISWAFNNKQEVRSVVLPSAAAFSEDWCDCL